MTFKTIKSSIEYQGRSFSLRREEVSLPNGGTSTFDIVVHPGSIIIIPVNENGQLLFVRQYRHAVSLDLLELPAGSRHGDETFEECAMREIREEIGMEAGKLDMIGEFYLAPGYSTEHMKIYLAIELRSNPLDADFDEFLSVEKIPVKKAMEMAERGEVPDAKSLAALFLARSHLEKYLD